MLTLGLPPELTDRAGDPAIARLMQGEVTLFNSRRAATAGQISQLRERISQIREEITGLSAQIESTSEQLRLIQTEIEGVNDLYAKRLVIDRLSVDQQVHLRFPAFNGPTTPDLSGSLSRISADLTQDSKTSVTYYLGRITLDEGELAKLAGKELVPGMLVEAFIQTGKRTAFAYLVKPLQDQLARSFRYD